MTRITFIPVRNKHLTLLARNPVFKAFAANTHMAQPQQTNLALDARQAFDSVEHGQGTEYHRDILAGTANVVMVLAEKHCSAMSGPMSIASPRSSSNLASWRKSSWRASTKFKRRESDS